METPLNEELENLAQRIEEAGKRPDYKRGGNYNDRVEYERLRGIFCDMCLKAVQSGLRFGNGPEK